MKNKIAPEEHFAIDLTIEQSRIYAPPAVWERLKAGLMDIEQQRLERANLFQDRDYPVLNDYRALLAGLFRSMWSLTPAQIEPVFPQTRSIDLKLV